MQGILLAPATRPASPCHGQRMLRRTSAGTVSSHGMAAWRRRFRAFAMYRFALARRRSARPRMNTMPFPPDPTQTTRTESTRNPMREALDLVLSFAIPVVGVVMLCRVFSPRWQTNDDIGMSMIAHGYGSMPAGSPMLGFSNLLWGYFVRSLPSVAGLLGYSVATFASLIAIGIAILYGLRSSTRDWLVSIALLCGVLVLPVLFPQFTVNAGLLVVAALVCWRSYDLRGGLPWLLCGCVLAFYGFLVRGNEAFLVFVIGCPLLPWGRLLRIRAVRVAGACLVLAIGVAVFADRQAYQGPEWQAFKAFNRLRLAITDYGAADVLHDSPQLLKQHGFSHNDIDLLHAWFFVDPTIADPQRLKPLLAQLPPRYANDYTWQRGFRGLRSLSQPSLLPLMLAALLLALLHPDRRILATWLLCIASAFALSVMFRPGMLRVYLPLASLLLLAPFIASASIRQGPRWRLRLTQCIVVAAAVSVMIHAFANSRSAEAHDASIRSAARNLPRESFVVWGREFPFQSLYPPLQRVNALPAERIEIFGVSTLAPYSRNAIERAKGNGFVQRLQAPGGVLIAASSTNLAYLKIYCRERLGGELARLENIPYGSLNFNRVRCAPAAD